MSNCSRVGRAATGCMCNMCAQEPGPGMDFAAGKSCLFESLLRSEAARRSVSRTQYLPGVQRAVPPVYCLACRSIYLSIFLFVFLFVCLSRAAPARTRGNFRASRWGVIRCTELCFLFFSFLFRALLQTPVLPCSARLGQGLPPVKLKTQQEFFTTVVIFGSVAL